MVSGKIRGRGILVLLMDPEFVWFYFLKCGGSFFNVIVKPGFLSKLVTITGILADLSFDECRLIFYLNLTDILYNKKQNNRQ